VTLITDERNRTNVKRLISTLAVALMLGMAAAASAETASAPLQTMSVPGTRIVLVDAQTGKAIGEFVAIAGRTNGNGVVLPEFREFQRAFSNTAPLTIWQENAAAERAIEGQGAPLHTP